MHRSDPKRAFLVQQQISELGPEVRTAFSSSA
jgi:hypothetical protein